MRGVTKVALGATALAAAWGLIVIPADGRMEPGFDPPAVKEIKHTGPHDHARLLAILNEPGEINQVLAELAVRCGSEDWAAEAWIEKNEDFELEAWGRCTSTFRSGS